LGFEVGIVEAEFAQGGNAGSSDFTGLEINSVKYISYKPR